MTTVRRAGSADDLNSARELFREYGETPGVGVCVAGFAEEIARLPQGYGAILLASIDGRDVGCGAIRSLADGVCELKRLYVRTSARGHHAGRTLALALLDEARSQGFTSVRLDTLPSMRAAISLYESLGFVRIPAYSKDNPAESLCFELTL